MLEKAWAKVFGSFQSIIWGVPGESLTNLTGAPCKFVPADKADPQRTWAQIHRAVASADGAGGARPRLPAPPVPGWRPPRLPAPASPLPPWPPPHQPPPLRSPPQASSQGWFAVALMPDDPEHDLQKEVGLVEGHACAAPTLRPRSPCPRAVAAASATAAACGLRRLGRRRLMRVRKARR